MTAVKEKAFAKINLYLDVTAKRQDGFHDVKTIMHSVSLYDDIIVSVVQSRELSVNLVVEGSRFLPNDSKNLAYRAALLFLDRLGVKSEVNIKLVKRIPIAAGLAGGSSDAAAVLRAMNKIYKRPFTASVLMKMASELGSDVPYCLVGKTALCEGRGEIITKIESSAEFNIVVASAKEHVSTPEAYLALDRKFNNFKDGESPENIERLSLLLNSLKCGNADLKKFYNVFENVILEKCPLSRKLKDEISTLGADFVMMSGSGPALFGVFKSAEEALAASNTLKALGYRAWYAKSV